MRAEGTTYFKVSTTYNFFQIRARLYDKQCSGKVGYRPLDTCKGHVQVYSLTPLHSCNYIICCDTLLWNMFCAFSCDNSLVRRLYYIVYIRYPQACRVGAGEQLFNWCHHSYSMLVDDTRNYKLDCHTAGGEGASQQWLCIVWSIG